MNFGNMTVRAKLGAAFGGLAILVLLVSGLSWKALSDANTAFDHYVTASMHAAIWPRQCVPPWTAAPSPHATWCW